jgi:glycosyltransferase involved in cell wall biosynthesis
MKSETPNLCIVGHMLGRNPGHVTSQGQILADLFESDGYDVINVSSKLNRVIRWGDVMTTIVKNRNKIEVLILEVYSGMSMIMADGASLLCKLFGIPLICVLHGGNLPEFVSRFPKWTGRVLKRADILVAPSPYLSVEMEKLGHSARVIPNVIDIGSYPYKLRSKIAPNLIWMRSFHPIYNPKMALDAFSVIKSAYPDATLAMAGVDKGLEADTKRIARENGMESAVRFPGFLDAEAKVREFSRADIYLNTNRIDNMPVSVLEACAMGLPVVATNVGGISRMLSDRHNALLVSDDNVDEMSRAVKELLTDRGLAERLSTNGKLLADRSSWAAVRPQWDDLFVEVLTRRQTMRGRTQLGSPG